MRAPGSLTSIKPTTGSPISACRRRQAVDLQKSRRGSRRAGEGAVGIVGTDAGGNRSTSEGSSGSCGGAVQAMYTLLTRLSQPVSMEVADEFAVVVPGYSGVPPLAPS